MPRPRPLPLTRALAALLVLVAAFAYPLRQMPTPDVGGGDPPGHCQGLPREEPPHHPAPPASHHGAHCLFCLTGAFALAPEPGVGVGAALPAPTAGRSPAPRAPHGSPTRIRARAPPALL